MKIINNSNLVCNFFTAKHYWSRFWSRWGNLDRFQYRFELGKFQPIRWQELLNSPARELRNRYVVLYFFSAHERAEFSLRSSRLLSFSRQSSNKRAKMRAGEEARLGCAKNWAELAKGWARRWKEKEGRKGIASSESQTFYWAPFAHEQEATVQFDWLLARQSKYDIRSLSFMHNPTSGTQQDQNWHGRVRRSVRRGLRILCSGNVERPFAKWQTHRSKTEARSCHESLVRKHDLLAIDSSNTRRRPHGSHCYLHIASQICL